MIRRLFHFVLGLAAMIAFDFVLLPQLLAHFGIEMSGWLVALFLLYHVVRA